MVWSHLAPKTRRRIRLKNKKTITLPGFVRARECWEEETFRAIINTRLEVNAVAKQHTGDEPKQRWRLDRRKRLGTGSGERETQRERTDKLQGLHRDLWQENTSQKGRQMDEGL